MTTLGTDDRQRRVRNRSAGCDDDKTHDHWADGEQVAKVDGGGHEYFRAEAHQDHHSGNPHPRSSFRGDLDGILVLVLVTFRFWLSRMFTLVLPVIALEPEDVEQVGAQKDEGNPESPVGLYFSGRL